MVSVCTLTSLLLSSCVLILCNLPDVSLSHWSINTFHTIFETTKSTNKLAKRLRLAKNKTDYMKKTKTVKLLPSYENLQLLQLGYKKS